MSKLLSDAQVPWFYIWYNYIYIFTSEENVTKEIVHPHVFNNQQIWAIIQNHCLQHKHRITYTLKVYWEKLHSWLHKALMLQKSGWGDDDDNRSWWFRTREATWCSCEKTNALILGKCPSEEPDWTRAIHDSLLTLHTHQRSSTKRSSIWSEKSDQNSTIICCKFICP